MSKRLFRRTPRTTTSTEDAPDYPTLESFDRRRFLARLGAAVVGASVGASVLSACGDGRAIQAQPDATVGPAGAAPLPDAQLDTRPAEPDGMPVAGGAPMPDAKLDTQPSVPDGMEIGGVAPPPDAKIDKADLTASPGFAPMMDAGIDGGECPNP